VDQRVISRGYTSVFIRGLTLMSIGYRNVISRGYTGDEYMV
jgi:hypothetical protein